MHNLGQRGLNIKQKNIFFAILSILFCASFMLIPIERGFPEINLGFISISWTSILVLTTFLFFFLFRRKEVLQIVLEKNYLFRQAIFIIVLLLTTVFQNPIKLDSLSLIGEITIIFLFLYLDLTIIVNFNKQLFFKIFFGTMSFSLIIGLIEGLTRKYLPFYLALFKNFEGAFYVQKYLASTTTFRIIGTLGHPILYSMLLASSIPIILSQAKNKYFKTLYTLLAVFTIFLTKSTTGFLMLLTLIFGYLVIKNERKYYIVFFVILLILGGIFITNPNFEITIGQNVFSLQRIFFGTQTATNARLEQINWVIQHFKSDGLMAIIFGHGTRAAIQDITKEIGPLMGTTDTRTIDNAFFTLVYDNGLLGLATYLFAFLLPLFTLLRKHSNKLLWWSLFAFILAGVSTDTYFYSTINFIFVLTWILLESPESPTLKEEPTNAL